MRPLGIGILMRTAGFRRAYLLRGLGVWMLLRMGYSYMSPDALELLPVLAIAGMAAGGVVLDAARRREDLFLANLGVSRWAIAMLACLLPITIELAGFVLR